jgi:hypothetical protein
MPVARATRPVLADLAVIRPPSTTGELDWRLDTWRDHCQAAPRYDRTHRPHYPTSRHREAGAMPAVSDRPAPPASGWQKRRQKSQDSQAQAGLVMRYDIVQPDPTALG